MPRVNAPAFSLLDPFVGGIRAAALHYEPLSLRLHVVGQQRGMKRYVSKDLPCAVKVFPGTRHRQSGVVIVRAVVDGATHARQLRPQQYAWKSGAAVNGHVEQQALDPGIGSGDIGRAAAYEQSGSQRLRSRTLLQDYFEAVDFDLCDCTAA